MADTAPKETEDRTGQFASPVLLEPTYDLEEPGDQQVYWTETDIARQHEINRLKAREQYNYSVHPKGNPTGTLPGDPADAIRSLKLQVGGPDDLLQGLQNAESEVDHSDLTNALQKAHDEVKVAGGFSGKPPGNYRPTTTPKGANENTATESVLTFKPTRDPELDAFMAERQKFIDELNKRTKDLHNPDEILGDADIENFINSQKELIRKHGSDQHKYEEARRLQEAKKEIKEVKPGDETKAILPPAPGLFLSMDENDKIGPGTIPSAIDRILDRPVPAADHSPELGTFLKEAPGKIAKGMSMAGDMAKELYGHLENFMKTGSPEDAAVISLTLATNGMMSGAGRGSVGAFGSAPKYPRELLFKDLEEMRELIKRHPEKINEIRALYGVGPKKAPTQVPKGLREEDTTLGSFGGSPPWKVIEGGITKHEALMNELSDVLSNSLKKGKPVPEEVSQAIKELKANSEAWHKEIQDLVPQEFWEFSPKIQRERLLQINRDTAPELKTHRGGKAPEPAEHPVPHIDSPASLQYQYKEAQSLRDAGRNRGEPREIVRHREMLRDELFRAWQADKSVRAMDKDLKASGNPNTPTHESLRLKRDFHLENAEKLRQMIRQMTET